MARQARVTELYALFRDVGRDLFLSGLVTARHGNLSVRVGDEIVITRTGAMLARLGEDDLVVTGIEPGPKDAGASRELPVHRAIYEATDALAVCHAHPPHTVARSLIVDGIEPLDAEAALMIGPAVQVLVPAEGGPARTAALVADAILRVPVAVVKGHGPFAIGATLWDAAGLVGILERSCEILDIVDASGRPLR